jgi:hypothetical protein
MKKLDINLNSCLYVLGSLFIATFGIGVILFSILASKSYCENKNNAGTECIEVGVVKIPNNTLPNLIGSFTGAFFTFCVFYFLEETKRKALPKPIIEVGFKPDAELNDDKFRELVVNCKPHYVYLEDKKKNIDIGDACYLRVKITNKGNIVGKNCRAYLKKIQKRGADTNWIQLKGYEDSMPLLWAYERKEDYYVAGSGRDLASKASDYADILVSCESYIALKSLENGEPNLQRWFLKLKTKRQVPKHAKLLEINLNVQSEFRLTVEVYADECPPSTINIILYHGEGEESIQVYDEKNMNQKAEFKLYRSMTSDTQPTDCSIEQIYESL